MAYNAINDSHNIISTNDAINVIETVVKAQINGVQINTPIIMHGSPGIGKSSIVRTVADKLNIGFVDIRLSMLERVDLCGLPSVENNKTKWNIPNIWPTDANSAGIIFLDEITSCAADLQCAAYSILCERCIPNTDYKIPDKWTIIAAGNRSTDKAIVKTMSSALANRFMHLDLEANLDDWVCWAISNDIDPIVTGYLRYRPVNLFNMTGQNLEAGWPSPRAWEKISNMLKLFKDNEEILRKVVYGLVGTGVGLEFMQFAKNTKKFNDVKKFLTDHKCKIVIPEKNDEKYAFISAVNYMLWAGKDDEEHMKRAKGFLRIASKLSPDFCAAMAKGALEGNKSVPKLKACSILAKTEGFAKFAKEYMSKYDDSFSLD